MRKISAVLAVLLITAPTFALELELEENRSERGSVGYVDMQRLFANSPDALHEKETFESLVRQAEERVNLRKAELLKLRQQLEAARNERSAVAQSTPVSSSSTAQAVALSTTTSEHLLDLDSKIVGLQTEIVRKEADLTHERDGADRGLLDVEGLKTDQVLARLYRTIREVARRQGVSIVLDKSAILYGHKAVDLTDKVLKYLQEIPPL